MQKHDARKAIHIWVIHDDKPGHLSQLQGLTQRLIAHAETTIRWIDSKEVNTTIKSMFGKTPMEHGEERPDMVLGAGHGTHRPLLKLAKQYSAISVVMMKPSFPLRMFDFVICPKHDELEENDRTLNTYGAINKIEPSKTEKINKEKHLVLLGGPSKHYEWDDDILLKEIGIVCNTFSKKAWHLSSSPRTPDTFLNKVADLNIQNLELHDYHQDAALNLISSLEQCSQAWITPDSVSMLYESLTSGCQTSIFSLAPNNRIRPSKVVKQVQELVQNKNIGNINMLAAGHMDELLPSTFWEAERAALWLLKKYTHLRVSRDASI